ncbi:hypothetical protein ACRAVF_27880 [Bradyrhizobium oligotrophicum S58]
MGIGTASTESRLDADVKRFVDALQAELVAAKDESERYRRITEERGVIMGRLRDERDGYRLEWEAASAELRRLARQRPAVVSDNGTTRPSGNGRDVALRNSPPSTLRVLCVGTGRDGTTSLARMMQEVFDNQGNGDRAVHEWASSELNELFCQLKETNDPSFADQISSDDPRLPPCVRRRQWLCGRAADHRRAPRRSGHAGASAPARPGGVHRKPG